MRKVIVVTPPFLALYFAAKAAMDALAVSYADVNTVADRAQAELFRRIGVEDLLHPRDTLAPVAS